MFEGKYELWGAEHSMFTRKLQALLQYQCIPHEFRIKSQAETKTVEARVGTHFIPALLTPEGWFIHDTTPIGLMLNAKYPDRPIIPSPPVQRIACHLLEDWVDEWFGRYAIHTRWCYPDTVAQVGPKFGANVLGKRHDQALTAEEVGQVARFGEMIKNSFGLPACKNRGCGPDQAVPLRADFNRVLDEMSAHFGQHRFILGGRASLADFTLAGVFKAHFECDLEPRAWVDARAPQLIDGMNLIWNARSGDEDYPANDSIPDTVFPFFQHMVDGFHRFLRASRDALARGEKWCEVDFGDGKVRMRALKYSEVSRLHVRNEIERLDAEGRATVDRVLGPTGALDAYLLPAAF